MWGLGCREFRVLGGLGLEAALGGSSPLGDWAQGFKMIPSLLRPDA